MPRFLSTAFAAMVLFAAVLMALLVGAGAPPALPASPAPPSTASSARSLTAPGNAAPGNATGHVLEVPLEQGVLEFTSLPAGAKGCGTHDDHTSWRLDLRDPEVARFLAAIEEAAGGAVRVEVTFAALRITFDEERAEELAEAFAAELAAGIKALSAEITCPPSAVAAPSPYGIAFVTVEGERLAPEAHPSMPRRAVVLVHGYDDPGWTWGSLIPVLHAHGFAVAEFTYPNDGAIADAADRLAASMRQLRAVGVERVDLVAHSMGGLVSRDMLTRADMYAGDGCGNASLPTVERLVMIGTPNQGSHVAQMGALTEIKDRLVRAVMGDGRLGANVDDGGGEGARDLRADSAFLRELNARPLARNVAHTIIAARMVDAESTRTWLERHEMMPRHEALRPLADAVIAASSELGAALGDGLVRIDDARLEGVDDVVIVSGTHHGMIARWQPGDPEPPSVAVILERLERPLKPDVVDTVAPAGSP